ncbi:uncharacterized protein [Physcomitrium patens]|uniref:Uncharacterized protein n=1 Tax=Physcomitrium patens TaxID=3218 RepID=A0A2K1LAQ8_PHYPA|nr:uncharacterized protein LOC112281555 [Physcomitrium patens]PNR63112.1 hypothetical protein PHYPA_001537 [Physcomitrium patens]|eukprot:XP_024373979.1 uncharacterized protein LOC112281555 [Physcomitrella patens]
MTTPYRDDTKGAWFRKSGQERDNGHRQCCSQHWVSVLNTNEKIYHGHGRAANSRKSGGISLARAKSSPTANSKFVAMAAQKLQVQDKRFLPLVVRDLDLSYSSLSNLGAIVHDISRLPRANSSKPSDDGFDVNHVPSSASAFMSFQKSSTDIDQGVKLQSPTLNSTAWLVARMEALKKETFTVSKALQIAKEHGIALGKKDVATLKKFFQSDQRPSMQCDTPDHSQLRISKSSEK